MQSTILTSTEPHSNNKYKDKVIRLSNLDETQSHFEMHKTYSISDFSKSGSKLDFLTPKKNKSLVALSQEKS